MKIVQVDLPVDTGVICKLKPNDCYSTFHSRNDRMCAPNMTKEGKKAFSCLFGTHLAITIYAMVSGRLSAMLTKEVCLYQA